MGRRLIARLWGLITFSLGWAWPSDQPSRPVAPGFAAPPNAEPSKGPGLSIAKDVQTITSGFVWGFNFDEP